MSRIILPIYPDDLTFSQHFMGTPSDGVVSSTSRQSLPHDEEVRKWAEAAKQFFEEEQDLSQVSSSGLKMEGLELSSLDTLVTKMLYQIGAHQV